MSIQHGKTYKIREQGSPCYETVSVDQVSSRGVVTVTMYGGAGWYSHRLDLTAKRVAELEWEEVVKEGLKS
jgi:hypothetical protein